MVPTKCIASIDVGSSSARVIIICADGQMSGFHQLKHSKHHPAIGEVEQDPLEIWKNVKICLSEALKKVKHEVEIVGIGITNNRETTIIWNKETGSPYHNAISWNDTRTSELCDELRQKFGDINYFHEKTGLPISTYFSASKIIHLLDKLPGLREDAEKGKALFGTIDSWLIWKLTNGKVHATDVSNASRTLLMNLKTLQWDEEILTELNIPKAMLPRIRPSSFPFGKIDTKSADDNGRQVNNEEDISHFKKYQDVLIAGVLGDQQAALFGQTCFNKGEAKCTYGTGAFFLMNTGHDIVQSDNGLLTTVAYQLGPKVDDRPVYALEGAVAYSGSLLAWLKDNLKLIESVGETEKIAKSVPDNGGVYFVPSFSGLYSPYWREDARGIIMGLTGFHTQAHIVRAALESSAFQTAEIGRVMKQESNNDKNELKILKVDGGVAKNDYVMQLLSDLLGLPVVRPKIIETTALGAAYVAGLEVGLWSSLEEIKGLWQKDKEWTSTMPADQRAKYVSRCFFFCCCLFLVR
jgi:glycerol kinase